MTEATRHKPWPGEPDGLWPFPQFRKQVDPRPDDERVDAIREGAWIDHRGAQGIRDDLVEFVGRPWEQHQSWRGLVLVGDPRNGRTTLVTKAFSEGKPVVVARMSAVPNAATIWAAMLEGAERSRETASLRLSERRRLALDAIKSGVGSSWTAATCSPTSSRCDGDRRSPSEG